MGQQSSNVTLRWGVIGAIIAALCCFTPVLAILLGVVGLSWAVGYLDYVLFPALAFFIGLTIYALWKRQKNSQAGATCECETPTQPQN
ncbi:MAG: mercury resistance system transport protein MerF [Caldilinea sp.]